MSSLLNNIISLTEKQQQRIVWKQNQKRRVQKKLRLRLKKMNDNERIKRQ